MKDLRLDNSIFIMYLASEEYKREHNITTEQMLELDSQYKIFSYIADCPDVFDSMTEKEMVTEIDEYIAENK